MQNSQSPVKRYWAKHDGNYNLDFKGYLQNPEYANMYLPQTDVHDYHFFDHYQCLVLLGEPGIGKTTEIKDIYTSSDENITLIIDLRSHNTDLGLLNALNNSEKVKNWLVSDYTLTLILDSLDECLLSIDGVASLLVDQLGKWGTQRLKVRIVCRTNEFPVFLNNELLKLFDEKRFFKVELLPLTKQYLDQILHDNETDSKTFCEAIERLGIVPLAIRPITLNFLISQFKRDGTLPKTRAEAYRQGLLGICGEVNPHRSINHQPDTKKRMIIAARMAAMILFSDKSIINKESVFEAEDGEIHIGILSGLTEDMEGNAFPVERRDVRDTLNSGLFNSRGDERLGFVHQTYMEFLAAYYIVHSRMLEKDILPLISHKSENIIPKFQELVSWLLSLTREKNKEFYSVLFTHILIANPEYLLSLDSCTDEEKKEITKAVLLAFESEKLVDTHQYNSHYHNLNHEGIQNLLNPFLFDKEKNWKVRLAALLIALECQVKEMLDFLVGLLHDSSEDLVLRKYAAYCFLEFGEEKHKLELMRYAKSFVEEDVNDGLKGIALRTLWPSYLYIDEMINCLTPPRQQNYYGAYQRFLNYDLFVNTQGKNSLILLRWIAETVPVPEERLLYKTSIDDLLCSSLEYTLDNSKAQKEFIQLLLEILDTRSNLHSYPNLLKK